jgi:phosphoserine phosphatase
MSALALTVSSKFKNNVIKQQTCTTSAVVLTALASTDAIIGEPEQIFVQALSTNSVPIYIGGSGVTAAGASIELVAGANTVLPSHRIADWYIICASGSPKLNIVYSAKAV